MSGALTNSIIVLAASSLDSSITSASSPENVAKYFVKNLRVSLGELKCDQGGKQEILYYLVN